MASSTVHVLWLIKFEKSEKANTSKMQQFLQQFRNALVPHNIGLIYAARNGPYIQSYKKTDLPVKDFDMTMVTAHSKAIKYEEPSSTDYRSFIKSKEFMDINITISDFYNVEFKTNEEMSGMKGIKNSTAVPFASNNGRFPPYPYPNGSYDFIVNNNEFALKRMQKVLKIRNKPFLMLNLMQIVDKKLDQQYTEAVLPLAYGVGARMSLWGSGKNSHFNIVGFMYYPNTESFWEMLSSKSFLKIAHLKYGSLKDVLLVPTFPFYVHPSYAVGKLSKL